MARQFLAIEIGGTKLQLFVGDERANIFERWRFDVNALSGGAGIREQIAGALPDVLRKHTVAAIGIGYGGPVDWQTGRVCCSHQIEGWADFPLGDWLRQRAEIPVVVDNDANVAALGEALCGAGEGRNPVFYVTLGSGVGGGCVVDGRVFHGAKPGESEIGHLRLDRFGTTVEQRCSGWAVDSQVREWLNGSVSTPLTRMAAKMHKGEARVLAPALRENCPLAKSILDELAENLAFALSHVTHLMHPEVIVLGGGLALVGEPLRAAVGAALKRFVMEAFAPGPQVRLAALGEDAVPVGALLLAGANAK
jgi:glucokinase